MRILLIEDDPLIGEGLQQALCQDGSEVVWARDGLHGQTLAVAEAFDVIVLDLGLPGMDGLTLLRSLRRRDNRTPCVVLTARDSLQDKVTGLDVGADDYLAKPFELAELKARLRAVARRSVGAANNVLRYGDLSLDTQAHSATLAGEALNLPRREYNLLYELLLNLGRVMTRERLEQLLYGYDDEVASNALEVHIHHLRKKIGRDVIRTVRGVGYTIVKPREC